MKYLSITTKIHRKEGHDLKHRKPWHWQIRTLLILGALTMLTAAGATAGEDLYFANSSKLADGQSVDIALDQNNQIVEIHEGASNFTSNLYYRTGTLTEGVVSWGDVTYFDKGEEPAVALNDVGVVVEIHETSAPLSKSMWYHVGTLSGTSIAWGSSQQHDTGTSPAIAMNNGGIVVQVHMTTKTGSSDLMYHVGAVDSKKKTITWQSSTGTPIPNISGSYPSISLNENNTVLLTYQSSQSLYYLVGQLDPAQKTVSWESTSHQYTNGLISTVELTDENLVVELHTSQNFANLWTATGTYDPSTRTISFKPFWEFEAGAGPAVAANDIWGIQIHTSDTYSTLWSSTGRIMDAANWMGDNAFILGTRTLKQLAAPGSHDAGMYLSGFSVPGKTQEWNLYDQLHRGARWFDLRPENSGGTLIIHHGIIAGPNVEDVLADVARFMSEGHKEVVYLKFGHFKNMTDTSYASLVTMIQQKLGTWLYTSTFSGRLADQKLSSLLGRVIPLFDNIYIQNHKAPGFFFYRDNDDQNATAGDLVVYDEYSNTKNLSKMTQDQLGKWSAYPGNCKNPCDLFLLSWTLTPVTAVWSYAKEANAVLLENKEGLQPHSGLVPNILYTDYVDYASAAYTANFLNSRYSMRDISMRRTKYFLKTDDGGRLVMSLDNSQRTNFYIENLPGGKVALIDASTGKYFCLGRRNGLYAVGDTPVPACRFEVVPTGRSQEFGLKASNGLYLRRYSNQSIAANDHKVGTWNWCYLH